MAYAILVVSAIFLELAVNLPTGSLPLALASDGIGPTGIATVAAVAALAPLLGSIPLGGLIDRFGRLRTMRIAAVASALAVFGLDFVHGLVAAAAVMAVRSLAITAYMTAQFAYASAIVRADRAVSAVATLGMDAEISRAVPGTMMMPWLAGRGSFTEPRRQAIPVDGLWPL